MDSLYGIRLCQITSSNYSFVLYVYVCFCCVVKPPRPVVVEISHSRGAKFGSISVWFETTFSSKYC